ncbi:MAG: hypothetical protein ACR2KC_02490, partial [Acidimicrobiales bacterium]
MSRISLRPEWLPASPDPQGSLAASHWMRPLELGEILDRAFLLLRANYRTLAPAVLVYSVPAAVASALATRNVVGGSSFLSIGTSGTTSGGGGGWLAVPYLVAFLAPALVAGSVCRVVAADMLGGRLERGAAIRGGLGRLATCVVAEALVVVAAAVASLFCVLPGVVVWTMSRLTLPVAAIEQTGAFASMARSWRLVASRFWPMLGLTVLVALVGYAAGQLLDLVPSALAAALGLHWGFLLLAAGSAAVATVTWSYT